MSETVPDALLEAPPGPTLWPFALETYGRPGVEALMLRLQDEHGQSVPLLLWSLWLTATDRDVDAETLAAGAALTHAWQDAAIVPLRDLRRGLKKPTGPGAPAVRERLRSGVKALELDAERMLLQMLEDASPAPSVAAAGPLAGLQAAAQAWSGHAPAALADLAQLAA